MLGTLPAGFRAILLTGAAGQLGQYLRETLRGIAPLIRLTDIKPMPAAREGEEVVQADLADAAAAGRLVEGIDLVIHFGGIPEEDSWDNILASNIQGCHNLWSAAHRTGVRRVIYASSNHAIGMYPRTRRLDTDAPPRPDTLYGLSKAFGEQLARMYWDRHGLEAVALRIGSCFPEPRDERMLATWLSYPDLSRLVLCCIRAPVVDYTVVYGMSANPATWWDNGKVDFLGYRPQDSAEVFAERIAAQGVLRDPDDPAVRYHGGHFVPLDFTPGRSR